MLWPLAATMAVAVAARWRSSRRRTLLNRALHELRRPLQALALGPVPARAATSRPGPLEQALAALDDLDAAVNGIPVTPARRPVAARPLVEDAIHRWHPLAAKLRISLELDWRAGMPVLLADPARVAQALDNLLANAIEHGAGPVGVSASRSPVGLSIRVVSPRTARHAAWDDPRRGHGLKVVERVATAHLGRFRLNGTGPAVVAEFELPLAEQPFPAIPIEWAPRRRREKTGRRVGTAADPATPSAA